MGEVIRTTEHDPHSVRDDDSLYVASKCWERVMNVAAKTGYREGMQDGADSVLQNGFDIGFKDGFKTAFMLGRYKGLAIVSMPSTLEHPADVTAILDKTRRGACWICSIESQSETSNLPETAPFSEILNEQRMHSTKIISRLCEYFKPVLKKSGIDLDSLDTLDTE
ncbi:hypothetical protein P5V15_004046 [Pogonomyrmex californicus]